MARAFGRAFGKFFAASLVTGLLSWNASAQQVTLKYSPWIGGPNHFLHADILQPWGKEVESLTEGRVKLEFLPKTVGSAQSQFDVVRDGLADMVLIVEAYTPGKFIGPEVGELPFMANRIAVLAPTYYRLFKKSIAPLGEYKGTRVVTTLPSVSGNIFTTTKPIRNLDDLKGLKLRATSGTTSLIANAIGVTPIQKPATEMYELLSTRVIDGTFGTAENVVLANKLGGVVRHMTLIPGGLYRNVISFLINEDAWKRISEKDRAAIDEISGEQLARKIGEAYDRIEDSARKSFTDEGGQIGTLNADATATMKAALAPLEQTWLTRAKERGMPDPMAFLAEFRAELAKQEAAQN